MAYSITELLDSAEAAADGTIRSLVAPRRRAHEPELDAPDVTEWSPTGIEWGHYGGGSKRLAFMILLTVADRKEPRPYARLFAQARLLGDELLHERANVFSFEVGGGTAVAMGSRIALRSQTRATFKLLFNAIFHGPAEPVTAVELAAATVVCHGSSQPWNRWSTTLQ